MAVAPHTGSVGRNKKSFPAFRRERIVAPHTGSVGRKLLGRNMKPTAYVAPRMGSVDRNGVASTA